MRIGAAGLALIKEFEGYHTKLPNGSCQAYLDKLVKPAYRSPGYKGLWTIGYGCTVGVTEGMVWTERQATKALMKEIAKHEVAVTGMVTVPLDQNEFDALVSFSYNLGSGALKKSTLLRKLNAGDRKGAADVFLMYNRAGGRVYAGLARRRKAERALFLRWTKKDVTKASKKLSLMKRFREFLGGLGISTVAISQFFSDAWQWMLANPDVVALSLVGLLGVTWLLMRWAEDRAYTDYAEGRYKPSGYDEDE